MEDPNFLLIDTIPESLEMDRDDKPPLRHPQSESLSHKLRAHYRKRFGHSKIDVTPTPPPPEFIGRISLPLYLLTVFCSLKLSLFDIMPLLYEGRDDIVFLQQCLVCFLFTEIMINWLGIRYVDSSYRKHISLYGNPQFHKQPSSSSQLKQLTLSSDSSSAVLMPLITQSGDGKFNSKKDGCMEAEINFTSAQRNFGNEKVDLQKEAESVNQWMFKQNEQINNKSIADLICIAEDNRSSSLLQQEQQNKPETKPDIFNLMTPKPVIRRNGTAVTASYPYWSWVPCYACRCTRPPRCHHCPLCKTCILKRDHHCFFAGSCIGYRNHRFFLVFLFWAWIGCVYAALHAIPYMSLEVWSQMSYFDICFPVAALRWAFGYLSFHTFLVMTTETFLIIFICITTGYLYSESQSISQGLTSFEKLCLKSSLEIKDTRRLNQKIRAIFGRYWLLNFLFPMHFFLKPEEDPIYWPHIQVIKH